MNHDHDHRPAPSADPGLFGRSPRESETAAVRLLIKHLDPGRLLPSITLHVQCTAGDIATLLSHDAHHPDSPATLGPSGDTDAAVARIEEIGPVLLAQLTDWFGERTMINLQPVLVPDRIPAVDAYEAPPRMRDALYFRHPRSVFPFSNRVGRDGDIDHTIPYRIGVPGQTGLHNLGPLSRPEHRYKTHGGVSVRQPEPGILVWRTRFGRVIITDHTGDHDLGIGTFPNRYGRLPSIKISINPADLGHRVWCDAADR